MEGGVLAEEDEQVARQNISSIPVHIFCHTNFLDNQFYDAKIYLHVIQEGPEDTLFVVTVSGATGGAGLGPTFNQECVNGIKANDGPHLL